MSYERKTYTDRHVENPGRRLLMPVPGKENEYDVSRTEGNIIADGDPFNAATMNNLEGRIEAGFSDAADATAAAQTAANSKAAKSTAVSVTLGTGWTGSAAPYTLTVSVTGMTAAANGHFDIAPTATQAQLNAFEDARMLVYSQAANSVTLRAWGGKPTISIPVIFVIVG